MLNWRFIRASPRTTMHWASWILSGCLWILGDSWYLKLCIVKMTNLDRFGKTKTSKPLFDHQCFKASAKFDKVMWSLWLEFVVSSVISLWERVVHFFCVPRTFLCFYLTVITQYLLLGLLWDLDRDNHDNRSLIKFSLISTWVSKERPFCCEIIAF